MENTPVSLQDLALSLWLPWELKVVELVNLAEGEPEWSTPDGLL